jgi:hypothetical protein
MGNVHRHEMVSGTNLAVDTGPPPITTTAMLSGGGGTCAADGGKGCGPDVCGYSAVQLWLLIRLLRWCELQLFHSRIHLANSFPGQPAARWHGHTKP